MVLLTLAFVVLFVVATASFAAGHRVALRRQQLVDLDRQAAIDAAVRSVLVERGATAEAAMAEREHTVAVAVDTAVKVAGSALDARLLSGTQHLDIRAHAFEQRAQDIAGELKRVSDLVAQLQRERARQHGEVVSRLDHTATVAATLQHTTQSLRDALASPKSRGQWGERMAEDVLRVAGFVEGVNYRQQATMAGGRRPDFTFLLPQGLELNMDVKFPVDNYLRFLEAQSDAERSSTRTAFLRDVRGRVKEITTRDYIEAGRTVDHVLLFIPNESVYTFIHENDPTLLDKALEQHVVLCSPSTLFAVLAVVRHSMRNFLFERTSDEILVCLTRFVKQWDKFAENVDKVGKHLGALSSAFDDLNGTRRRQLEKELERIEALRSQSTLAKADDVASGGNDPAPPWSHVRSLRAG